MKVWECNSGREWESKREWKRVFAWTYCCFSSFSDDFSIVFLFLFSGFVGLIFHRFLPIFTISFTISRSVLYPTDSVNQIYACEITRISLWTQQIPKILMTTHKINKSRFSHKFSYLQTNEKVDVFLDPSPHPFRSGVHEAKPYAFGRFDPHSKPLPL